MHVPAHDTMDMVSVPSAYNALVNPPRDLVVRDAWRVAHAYLRGIGYERAWWRARHARVDWGLVTRMVMRATGASANEAWDDLQTWQAVEVPMMTGTLGTFLGMQFIIEKETTA